MNDVLTAAILQAALDGDTATVEKLKALADEPDELGDIVRSLQSGRATTGYAWDESKIERGQPGNAGQFAPKGKGGSGGKPEGTDRPKGEGGGRATTAAGKKNATKVNGRKRPAKVARVRDTGLAKSRRVKLAHKVERELAEAIQGGNLPDSEPADVVFIPDAAGEPIEDPAKVKSWLAQRKKVLAAYRKRQSGKELTSEEKSLADAAGPIIANPAHFFEVKTLQKAAQDRVRITADALAKKRQWEANYGIRFHVVIRDNRRGGKHSGHDVYVAPNTLAKTVRLADCVKADGMARVIDHVWDRQ